MNMLPLRIQYRRLLPLRRPLLPVLSDRPRNPRLFTQNSQLLLISPPSPRPQLPFLHDSSRLRAPRTLSRNQFQHQLSRLLTTERKSYIKEQIWLASKYTVYGWTAFGLLSIMAVGIQDARLEWKYPSPPCWSWVSRMDYRFARAQESTDANASGLIDWARTGTEYRALLGRLENPKLDGQGLRPPLESDGDIYVEGLGKMGLDVSAKPESWRRGYHTLLMGAARAAEHLDGWVRDTTRNVVFPSDVVIGPSNPRPKPVPLGAKSAPLEETCVAAFEPPETYYMKILTTQGFTTRQRLDAALAYADWLDFKGLPSSAEEMYDWGIDIATGALPTGVNDVVDTKTGIINEKATDVSSNVLLASTSLAIHQARNNKLNTALPILLSVLRARRNLVPVSQPLQPQMTASAPEHEIEPSTFQMILSLFRSLITAPPYPPPSPTGDEPATRTPAAICEEAGLMTYIGEILFASPSGPSQKSSFFSASQNKSHNQPRQSGLSWTRDAVELAEKTLQGVLDSPVDTLDAQEAKKRCSECLEVGMKNWAKMVDRMVREEQEDHARRSESQGKSGSSASEVGKSRWEVERRVVEERKQSLRVLVGGLGDGAGVGVGGISSGFMI